MICKVIVDISNGEVDRIFDYVVPDGLCVGKGDRVLVPFGNKKLEGFCIDTADKSDYDETKLRPVLSKLDEFACISEEMLALMRFMKEKFYLRYIDCLRLFIPGQMRGGKVRELKRIYVRLSSDFNDEAAQKLIPARAKRQLELVAKLKEGGEYMSVIAEEFGAATVNALVEKGLVEKTDKPVYRKPYRGLGGDADKVRLTQSQQDAVDRILNGDKTVSLLYGVTGSGKTEVYMNAIQRVLDEGKTAIMLVPEISLTPQMLRNFRARFSSGVAMLHSGLSQGERYDEWKRLLTGEARIVVGARSAIFAPLKNVGLIVIDEEHDASYFSESNPRYNTCDIARFRAQYNGGKLVLGSATPSIESYLLAKKGEYSLVSLPDRISRHGMPKIEIVSMSDELICGNNGIFSRRLEAELKKTIQNGNQAILFLNRRGHSSFAMCRKCGYIAKCEDCDVTLTYHSVDNMLKCHYCGKRYKMLTQCPECGSKEIRYGKVGTQRVVEELQKMFPGVGILRMDNETTTKKSAYLDILGAFKAKEAQILVGTQMIAKGHDFPDVTLVGILDADMSLYFSDYRSAERTFQLVTQVAGRAGRSEKEGLVVLQTYSPSHYVYRFAKNYDYPGFFLKENNAREVTGFPPYSTILRVLMTGEDDETVKNCAKNMFVDIREYELENKNEFLFLQAMRSPVARIERNYRYQILMRIKREYEEQVTREVYRIIDENKTRGVSVFAQINPQSMS